MGYGRYLLLFLSFLHFSCSEDDVVLEQETIEGNFYGNFLKFTYNGRNDEFYNFYHFGTVRMREEDRIRLTRCSSESEEKCITITINGSALDNRTLPFTVGEAPNENGEIELREGFITSTGTTTKDEITITILSMDNDILEGTFAGVISSKPGSSILIDGKFRIKIFRYVENIDLDTCEAGKSSLYPTSEDPPLLIATVNDQPIEWIGDGCNFKYYRNGFGPYEVILSNAKLYSPPTKEINIGLRFYDVQDTLYAKHEVGIKKMFDGNDGFIIELVVPDMEATSAAYSSRGVEQPVNAFEIISRSEIHERDPDDISFLPWFEYTARLNLRMRGINGEEILVVGEVFMRALL